MQMNSPLICNNTLLKVAALTSGKDTPSARFRLRQHFENLRKAGIVVQEYCPSINQGARVPGPLGNIRSRYVPPLVVGQMALNLVLRAPGIVGSHHSDVTWLERNFIPGFDDVVVLLRKPLIVDIDDAIWLYNPLGKKQISRLVGRADMVFAGNTFLADWCAQYCTNIRIIPTAVDEYRFVPRLEAKNPDAPFIVGWTGTSGNFRFLKTIEKVLGAFLRDQPSAKLMVIADRPPHELAIPSERMIFHQWDPATEHLLLQEFDVGIMPLDDSELSRGKCSFKMLQYMATGMAVIASPYGMNAQVLSLGDIGYAPVSEDDWYFALGESFKDREKLRRFGIFARKVLLEHFSASKISLDIAAGLRDVTR